MTRLHRIRELYGRGVMGTAPPMSAFLSSPAAGQQSFQRAGGRHSISSEGSLYSYPSIRGNQSAKLPPSMGTDPRMNAQNQGMGGPNLA
ncbi:hypothetical protein PSTG_04347 [Puccinia striiformis f. sp. tritici PST-78]|uniref:Uncharacterized protein n=1 Tax=Puccinia striiformis f. sp. tritici PST-78 TaxID=1165861 RepID=A0A0L0VT49_9BASI|nr:hypothetical protein PSTG_04347 [Puccinia striiformis f. sp. tritici PST-78]